MPNEQASDGLVSIDDVAQFLVDNPEADTEEDQPNADEPQEDNPPEEEEAPAEDTPEEDESEKPKEQTSGLKFKVPVKGEDGSDTTIEVDEKELIAGYQRHADYTRKTQALADQEREITQKVAEKLEEGRGHYMQQAQLARAAVMQLAGLRSPQEMAQLAHSDPATWVQESQRAAAVQAVLSQLEQGMTHEQAKRQQEAEANAQKEISRAWGVLGQHGIDKPKLTQIYEQAATKYGVPKEMLHSLTNPQAVLIIRDALAYQGLKDKKGEVVKKAQDAPKLPQRQSVPAKEQRDQQLNRKFYSGKAKLSDLAAYLANS